MITGAWEYDSNALVSSFQVVKPGISCEMGHKSHHNTSEHASVAKKKKNISRDQGKGAV